MVDDRDRDVTGTTAGALIFLPEASLAEVVAAELEREEREREEEGGTLLSARRDD